MDSKLAFNKAFYKATHNSYAGGSRGPIHLRGVGPLEGGSHGEQ